VRIKRQLDDPRTLGEPIKGAVIFAFGMVGPARLAIPGPVLVAIMGALGFGEPTARGTILRMRRDGRLTSRRRGPVVDYALTPASRSLSEAVLASVMGERPRWDGGFHSLFVAIPERDRAYRDALRRALMLAGYGLLQPGVFVAPDGHRWARIEPILRAAPTGSRLIRAYLQLSLDDARAAAGDAWPLANLASRYRTHAVQLEHVVAQCRAQLPSGADALRSLWDAMAPVFATAAEDPALPSELLPDDWPGEAVRQAVVEASMALGPVVQAHLRELMPDA
jgi:phenylacetic acid degradation operon negative regulatory protein